MRPQAGVGSLKLKPARPSSQPIPHGVSGNPPVFCRTMIHSSAMNAGPLVAVLVAYLVCPPAWAERSACIQGRVLDPSEAVVPQAAVTIVNQESGFRRVTETGSDGGYAVGSLDSGVYKITVRKDGFRTMIRFNVKVTNLEAAHVDFTLSVGAVQETITVEGTAPPPGQEDASIGVRIIRDDIQRLPLNGRGVLGLLELSPGTNVTPATRGESGQFTANGQRPNANYFTVDGASANTGVTAGGLPAQATGGVLPALSAFGSRRRAAGADLQRHERTRPAAGRERGADQPLRLQRIPRFRRLPLPERAAGRQRLVRERGWCSPRSVAFARCRPILRRPHPQGSHLPFSLLPAHDAARVVRFAATRALRCHARRRAVLGPAGAGSLPPRQRPRSGQRPDRLVWPQRPAVATR